MNFQRVSRRPITSMSSSTMEVSPFTKVVVSAMRKLYPEKLADSSFDNTGLLLEAPYRPGHLKNSALLTIDLTKAVADEAIKRKDSIIISYHPIIFRPLKSLTSKNTQQTTLLRLAQEGISVYSPHTAVDAAPGGLNDWLVNVVNGRELQSNLNVPDHAVKVINSIPDPPEGFEKAGFGRIVTFSEPQLLGEIMNRISFSLSRKHELSGLSVAVPQYIPTGSKSKIPISTIGICAGSGGSMLNGLDVDLLFTGELSHHEALAAIEAGRCVVTAFHSNTERAFLSSVMCDLLAKEVKKEIAAIGAIENGQQIEIEVSAVDRDPFEIVRVLQDGQW